MKLSKKQKLYRLEIIKQSIKDCSDEELYQELQKSIKHLYQISKDIRNSYIQIIHYIETAIKET